MPLLTFLQVVTLRPIEWEHNPDPFTIMGDYQSWTDYSVTITTMAMPLGPGPSVHAKQGVIDACAPSNEWVWDAAAGTLKLKTDTSLCLGLYGPAPKYSQYPNVVVIPCNTSKISLSWDYNAAKKAFQPRDHPSLCLDVLGQAQDFGTPLITYSCNYNANEQWTVDSQGHLVSGMKDTLCVSTGPAITPDRAYVQVCSRIATYQRNGPPPDGYCLQLDTKGVWTLAAGTKALAQGSVASGQDWHQLELQAVGSTVTALVDGVVVQKMSDSTYSHGMVAVGSGWHQAFFDDFAVKPL